MQRFLSKQRQNSQGQHDPWMIPDSPDFILQDIDLLNNFGSMMHVGEGDSVPFSPTPFSRAVTYAKLLFSVQPSPLQAKARRTFRGMWSFLALRELLNIRVSVATCPINVQGGSPLRTSLMAAMNQVPGGQNFWGQMPHVVINGANGNELFCGLSPMTILYPSAHPPRSLEALYWYDYQTGEWYDPTSNTDLIENTHQPLRIKRETVALVQSLMHSWLNMAIAAINANLEVFNCPAEDATRIRNELVLWRQELQDVDPRGTVIQLPVNPAVALFNLVLDNAQAELWWGMSILSDLPIFGNSLMVSEDVLRAQPVRIYGMMMSDLGCTVAEVRQKLLPLVVVSANDIFTPNLAQVDSFSDKWAGAVTTDRSRAFLLPYKSDFVSRCVITDLCVNTTVESRGSHGFEFLVTLNLNGTRFSRLYVEQPQQGQNAGKFDGVSFTEGKLDVRIFPDFYVTQINALPQQGQSDVEFYVRVRSNPYMRNPVTVISQDDTGHLQNVRAVPIEQTRSQGETPVSSCYMINSPHLPAGVCVEDCGYAFFKPQHVTVNLAIPTAWDVAVDFGTANTCISYRTPVNGCRILKLPAMCSAMARSLKYGVNYVQQNMASVSEYGRAILDFFFLFDGSEQFAYDTNYFPSQLFTVITGKQPHPSQPGNSVDLRNGLIFFKNVSLEKPVIMDEIESFPLSRQDRTGARPFNLKSNIKWENIAWREPFMRHLRKMIVLSAAKSGATVKTITFSYPRAFDSGHKQRFSNEVQRVWGAAIPCNSISESAALHSYFMGIQNVVEHVVLDIGGGTTDILAMNRNRARYQSSFKLAASQINDFVTHSLAFREALLDAASRFFPAQDNVRYKTYLSDPWTPNSPKGPFLCLAWFGLLKNLGDDIIGKLAPTVMGLKMDASDAHKDAVARFFMVLTVLFTSIAFFAGKLFKASLKRQDGARMERVIWIHLAGNGAKLFDFLEQGGNTKARKLMEDMFKAGLGLDDVAVSFQGIPSVDHVPSPKELVALGAIDSVNSKIEDKIETGYFDEDIQFFQGQGQVSFNKHPMVEEYISELNKRIVNGAYDGDCVIIPYATRPNALRLGGLYDGNNGLITGEVVRLEERSRERYQADVAQQNTDAAQSTEPRFISHIISIIEKGIIG